MAIKKVEARLSFWESTYLPEILKGLRLTARHFFRNILIHLAHKVGLARHLRGAETYQYPEERRPLASRLRTLHRLTRRDDGSPRCVACMMCETACPARCIYIVGGEHPNPQIEKYPVRFDIDLGLVRLLRLLRGGVSRGRHPDGHGNSGVLLLLAGRNGLRHGEAPGEFTGAAKGLIPSTQSNIRRNDRQ